MFEEDEFIHKELGRRAKRLIALADWDVMVDDLVIVDWLRIRLMGDSIVIQNVKDARTVDAEHITTGIATAWNADLIPAALATLRRYMVLEDLADV